MGVSSLSLALSALWIGPLWGQDRSGTGPIVPARVSALLWWCVGDAVWGVVYCLARALHSEDLRTWCSARVSQWLVLRRVRGGVLRPP